MLTKEQIIKNATKFFQTANTQGFMTEEFTAFLGQQFISSPTDAFSHEGSLIENILNITKNIIRLNDLLPEVKKIDKNSLIKVAFLHQIGKAHMFKPSTADWKIKKGEMYDYAKLVAMHIGQRSLYYTTLHCIKLTEEEAQAIMYHNAESDDKMIQGYGTKLTKLLRLAIELTNIELK